MPVSKCPVVAGFASFKGRTLLNRKLLVQSHGDKSSLALLTNVATLLLAQTVASSSCDTRSRLSGCLRVRALQYNQVVAPDSLELRQLAKRMHSATTQRPCRHTPTPKKLAQWAPTIDMAA